jgi:acetyltransferase-like isoleucine patch superfamily enzyme
MNYSGGILYLPERLIGVILRKVGSRWAVFKAKKSFQKVGRGIYISGSAHFRQPSIISLGNNCKIYGNVRVIADYPGGPLDLHDSVQVNAGVHLDTTGGLTIGENTLISEQAKIYTHDHGTDPRSAPIPRPKKIGANVWIGMRTIILPSCEKIGEGAIIGAGAIVTRNVPSGVTVVGNPARPVKVKEGNV